MKASIKLFKSDGANKDGTYPIKLIIRHLKGSPLRKTIGKSFEEEWNPKDNMPFPDHNDFNFLYSYLIGIKKRIGSNYFMHMTDKQEAQNYLLQKDEEKTDIDFYNYANKRIKYLKSVEREGNADAYNDAVTELKKFRPTLMFSDIKKSLISQFKEHKKSTLKKNGDPIKNTTIRAYLNALKAIYNKGILQYELKDNEPFKKSFDDLNIIRRPKNIYIDKNGIKKLEDANLDVSYLQRTIDMVLLQFYFCGADFTEVYHLKHKELQNGRAFIKRSKLGEKAYEFDFKVFEKAQYIIDKYKTNKGEFVFPWRKDKTGYKTFMNNHRRDIKVVFKMLGVEVLPKHDSFTTKSVRHSFATIAKFERIDVDIIRELMGHERTDIDTVYKDSFPEEDRDAAHWKIISI